MLPLLMLLVFTSSDVEMTKSETTDFTDFGAYEAVVPLEAHDNALIGKVTFAKIDPRNGDILIQGEHRTGMLHRFDAKGTYLRTYGTLSPQNSALGPGEYRYLYDFVITDGGSVVIFDYLRILIFDEQGQFIGEKRRNAVYFRAVHLNGKTYAYSNQGRLEPGKPTILIFDEDFEQIGEFHPWDERWNKWRASPFQYLTTFKGNIYVADAYDFALTVYDPWGKKLDQYEFAETDIDFASLPDKVPRAQIGDLFRRLNRSIYTYGLKNRLFAYQTNPATLESVPCLIDFQKRRLARYDRLPFALTKNRSERHAIVDHIAGRYQDGLICVIHEDETLRQARPFIPALKKVPDEILENPVLLFLKVVD